MSEDEFNKQLRELFDPNIVASHAKTAAVVASEIVALSMQTFEAEFLPIPERRGEILDYICDYEPPRSIEDRRKQYSQWMLGKGFGSLHQGARLTLVHADIYLSIFGLLNKCRGIRYSQIASVSERARKRHWPELIKFVSGEVDVGQDITDAFNSLNEIRVILEHDAGVVSRRRAKNGDEVRLRIPALETIAEVNGEWIVAPGGVVDTHAPGFRRPDGSGRMGVRLGTRELMYRVGETVQLTAHDFYDMCFACHLFADKIGAALPVFPAEWPLCLD